MGKKATDKAFAITPSAKDLIPGYHPYRQIKGAMAAGDEMFNPEMPGETSEERAARSRQAETLARLDEDENRRVKGIMQGTLNTRLLRNARATSRSASSGVSGTASSGSGDGAPGRPTASRKYSLVD